MKEVVFRKCVQLYTFFVIRFIRGSTLQINRFAGWAGYAVLIRSFSKTGYPEKFPDFGKNCRISSENFILSICTFLHKIWQWDPEILQFQHIPIKLPIKCTNRQLRNDRFGKGCFMCSHDLYKNMCRWILTLENLHH